MPGAPRSFGEEAGDAGTYLAHHCRWALEHILLPPAEIFTETITDVLATGRGVIVLQHVLTVTLPKFQVRLETPESGLSHEGGSTPEIF